MQYMLIHDTDRDKVTTNWSCNTLYSITTILMQSYVCDYSEYSSHLSMTQIVNEITMRWFTGCCHLILLAYLQITKLTFLSIIYLRFLNT